jgi:hypothetical protein
VNDEELTVISDRVEYAYESVQDPTATWCGSDACNLLVLDAAALLGYISELRQEREDLQRAVTNYKRMLNQAGVPIA